MHCVSIKGLCECMYCESQIGSGQNKDYLQALNIERMALVQGLSAVIVYILWVVLYMVDYNGLSFISTNGVGGMDTIFNCHTNYLSCHIEKAH